MGRSSSPAGEVPTSDILHDEPDEGQQLLPSNDGLDTSDSNDRSSIHWLLYTSHCLSAWNSRVFEFGAFLFLAAIYPGTLLPASVYALTRAASATFLSPTVGSFIDKTDRMQTVRISIGKLLCTGQSRYICTDSV